MGDRAPISAPFGSKLPLYADVRNPDDATLIRPRLTVTNSYIGISPDGSILPNGIDGIQLYKRATDAFIGVREDVAADIGILSAVVIGANLGNGISIDAPRLTVANFVYIGVMPDGRIITNGHPAEHQKDPLHRPYLDNIAKVDDTAGIFLTNQAHDATIGGTFSTVIGSNLNGIFCDAARLSVSNTYIGIMPDGSAVSNTKHGVYLSERAVNARIGSAKCADGKLQVSGMCKAASFLNGVFSYQGRTLSGVPYFKQDGSSSHFLYRDLDCASSSEEEPKKFGWYFGKLDPSIAIANHGDHNRCGSYFGYVGDTPVARRTVRVSISGACTKQSELNADFLVRGATADNKPYYQSEDGTRYLYFDKDCDGKGGASARWIFDSSKPNITAASDLDGDGKCGSYSGRIDSISLLPPKEAVWRLNCDPDGWTDVSMTVSIIDITSSPEYIPPANDVWRVSCNNTWTDLAISIQTRSCGLEKSDVIWTGLHDAITVSPVDASWKNVDWIALEDASAVVFNSRNATELIAKMTNTIGNVVVVAERQNVDTRSFCKCIEPKLDGGNKSDCKTIYTGSAHKDRVGLGFCYTDAGTCSDGVPSSSFGHMEWSTNACTLVGIGTQALYAQQAGGDAILIVNKDDRSITSEMLSSGADTAAVTIPVYMIDHDRGMLLVEAIQTDGSTKVTIKRRDFYSRLRGSLSSGTTFISNNNGHGIWCAAPQLYVANAWIGLSPNNSTTTAAGNGGDGIRLDFTASDARIGAAPFDSCSSGGYMVCTTASCCEIAKEKLETKIIAYVSEDGCKEAAKYLQLQDSEPQNVSSYFGNLYSSLWPYGCVLNDGVVYQNFDSRANKSEPCGSGWRATDQPDEEQTAPFMSPILKCTDGATAVAWPTRISANTGAGIKAAGPRLAVANTYVGLGSWGEHSPGVFGNKGAGIVLDSTASSCKIGVDTKTGGTIFVGGNHGSGIQAAGANLHVVNAVIGIAGNRPAPNNGTAGIELMSSAKGALVGTSGEAAADDKDAVWIAGNAGSGIVTHGDVHLSIHSTAVGFNQQNEAIGNQGYGLLLDEKVHRFDFSRVGSSGNCGVRIGNECIAGGMMDYRPLSETQCNPLGTSNVFKNVVKPDDFDRSKSQFGSGSSMNDDDIPHHHYPPSYEVSHAGWNGQRTDACGRCKCTGMPERDDVETSSSTKVVVDCSADNESGRSSNFGADFFSSIPTNIVSLAIPSANLVWMDWKMLFAAAQHTLEVLDLSGNPTLLNPFPPPHISFPNLATLNLRGSRLKGLKASSIQNLCGSATLDRNYGDRHITGFPLQSLDLSGTGSIVKQHGKNPDMNVSGACSSQAHFNGRFVYQGKTHHGNSYYKKDNDTYIYRDSNCDNTEGPRSPRWIIDEDKPNTTAASDLDSDGDCSYGARIDTKSDSNVPPGGSNIWHMSCNGNWIDVIITIVYEKDDLGDYSALSTRDVKLNLTGFTNLAAFAWYNKSTCPPGFYPTTDSPSNSVDILCGKCPSGTEKLLPGGSRQNCKPCQESEQFDFDDDASTACEKSRFRVLEFEHYIPTESDESRYAFSKSKKDSLNNDPLRPEIGAEEQHPTYYFGKRRVVVGVIGSYQTLYADVPILLPPINITQDTSDGNITFTISGVPKDFFVNPDTGSIFANPSLPGTAHNISYNATIFAVDGKGTRAEIERVQFTVIKQDTATPANGPGNEDCAHGGSERIDGIKFDGMFTCNCSKGFENQNCSTSVSEKHAKLIVGIICGCIMLGLFTQKWHQRHAAKRDAIAALNRARRAYGLQTVPTAQQGLSVRSGDLVGVTTNPAFVGITFDPPNIKSGTDVELLLGNDHADGYANDELRDDDESEIIGVNGGTASASLESKFVAPVISLGKNTLAAKGLDILLGIDPKTYMHVKQKVKVMLKEFAKSETAEDYQNITTLLNGTYKHPPNGDGSPLTADEIRGQSITMEALMASDAVRDAGLEFHHVLALRLYTTSSYKSINNPMRQSPPVLPHPFGATLYYISDALSKLREVQGKDPTLRNTSQVYWRGMKNLQITEEFLKTGGTEMACMSTTSSRKVAEEFALSDSPLLFKFVSKSFMSHGADISFLSVYPGEKEVLYPPLTYLRPIKLSEETIGTTVYRVAEVEPVFPK